MAFRGCEDLAFDLESDPDEQVNLARVTSGEVGAELERLRSFLYYDFDFDAAEKRRLEESARLAERYAARVRPRTPNQILRGDGQLVEADQALYSPAVVSADPRVDFDDYP